MQFLSSQGIQDSVANVFNPLNGHVSDSPLNAGVKMATPENISKCFPIYTKLGLLNLIAICTNMQKIRPISKKFTEILRFKNFETTRFCCTLLYESCRNLFNFQDTKVIFWI